MAEDQRRTDHFAYLKHAPAAPPPEKNAPTVLPSLVEHLEQMFPVSLPTVAGTQDGLVVLASEVARMAGEQRVIAAIRELVRGA